MNGYSKVIRDSVSPAGIRLTTMEICMHRFVLAEFNTHRMFSRNFRSSRAVPVSKLIQEVRTSPALPVCWQANKPGMQGGDLLDPASAQLVETSWRKAASDAADHAENLMHQGLHKSWANRVIEPYLWVYGVVTSTNFVNFYNLRRHKDAQPEIHELADQMYAAQSASVPELLTPGEWHMPYVTFSDFKHAERFLQEGRVIRSMPSKHEIVEVLKKVSVARCARVSYKTHDGRDTTIEEDVALYERLVGSAPLHASPAEHQATPDVGRECYDWLHPEKHGNFEGWIQLRKTLKGECITEDAFPMMEEAL